jgi:(1->4)-alpha-D-glucan 1-alpha-D-glucosylmutase
MRIPIATYRLQITEEFTLHEATSIVPYLARLGITDLYLSPIFEARPGSAHGYDVTDPTRVREAVGGEAALHTLAEEARRHDMGILLDIVPNHMAASVHNPWWRHVLEHGQRSQFARFFDIDWGTGDAPRRLRLPILGDTLDRVVEQDEIEIDVENREAVYYDTRLPLAAGTVRRHAAQLAGADRRAAVLAILEQQHYELAFWRTASEDLNYRRFFDITDLAGVRVEDDEVFAATHSLVRTLAADGVITGLRIDHIDGLRDPAGYLRKLRARVRGPAGEPVYTVVEKILERDEQLPSDWACEGTTGYEFLNIATGLLLVPDGVRELDDFYRRITGDLKPFGELVREKKLLVMERLFGSELTALGRSLAALIDMPGMQARHAVAEATASMSVYRTYICSRQVRAEDRARIDAAFNDATRRNPGYGDALDAMHRLLLLEHAPVTEQVLDWIARWQQFTGPVMAKGFEDTALYCHNALLAANDVGSDPERPAIAAEQLHAVLEQRNELSPRSLNTTATHDTKRGEDTRARVAVLSELPHEWRRQLRRWMREGDEWKNEIAEEEDIVVPEADVDSLLYQTLVGAWPLHHPDDSFTDRIKEYMTKAVREAKEQTSWRRPDEDYEQALARFIELLMTEVGREGLAEDVASFAAHVAPHGALNSLAQTLLRITAPGIPDTYQGTELWSYTLVDPDNRRPVDYEERRRLLDDLSTMIEEPVAAAVREMLDEWQDGRIKLLFTAAALHCRARHADAFDRGQCVPLNASGSRAEHVVAFARALDGNACIVALPRWTARLTEGAMPQAGPELWQGTVVLLPDSLQHARWRNVLTGEEVPVTAGGLELGSLFATVPFALLEPALV